jgi:uncharacterized damage-inducible protein DinB
MTPNTTITAMRFLFQRDIGRLKAEISAYQNETKLWLIDKAIANSAGNLCLHLLGNLNTYIGAELGGTGYIRDRDREFSDKDVPRSVLLSKLEEVAKIVDETLQKIDPAILEEDYPQMVFAEKVKTGPFLLHLCTHLTYHLGQINYHRRLLDH